jgi:hypothetical protein
MYELTYSLLAMTFCGEPCVSPCPSTSPSNVSSRLSANAEREIDECKPELFKKFLKLAVVLGQTSYARSFAEVCHAEGNKKK